MNRKKSKTERLVCTMLTVMIVLSIFTAGLLSVSAEPEQAAEATVTRSLPDYVQSNELFTVSLTQSGFWSDIGIVWEVLPEGFEYVNGSYTGGWTGTTYDPATRTLMAGFFAEYTISYSVKAASDEQTAAFSGTYKAFVLDPIEEEGDVTGDTTVIVDGTPPYTDGHNPAKGATGVPVDTNIVVHAKDNFEVDETTIEMTVNGIPVAPSIVPADGSGSDDWVVTYNPPVDFGATETVAVTIDAADAAGTAMSQDAYSFTTGIPSDDTTPPAAITDLATSNPTTTTIDLTWIAPGDDGTTGTATAYDIRYRAGAQILTEAQWGIATPCAGEPGPQVAGSSETFTVTGLNPSTTYYFAIKTMDEVPNWSPLSNNPSGTTTSGGGDTTPPVISNIASSLITNTTTTITWDTDEVADSLVKYGTTQGGPYGMTASDPTDVTSHSVGLSGLTNNTTYYYVVNSTDPSDNSAESGENSFTTLAGPPGPDEEPPVISNPTADPSEIPDDTDSVPGWNETSDLSVTVTDASAIASVTINLSVIGGSATQPMTNTGGDVWAVSAAAANGTAGWTGTAYVAYSLQVNATDEHGQSNTATSIELMVMKNGDVDESGDVNLDDGIYLANYALGVPGYDLVPGVADVDGSGAVNLDDGIYLANYALGVPGYELH
jgi:hypothetical protein